MLPSAGHIFLCPFADENLYNETDQRVTYDLAPSNPAHAYLRLSSSTPQCSVSLFCDSSRIELMTGRYRLPGSVR
jgi:hypothetical protein